MAAGARGRAFKANGQDLEHLKGYVADSGEGRWTVQEAIDHDVPAPVITLSPADPVPLPPGRLVRRQGARRAAQRIRRPRGEDRVSPAPRRAATRRRRRRRPTRRGRTRDAPDKQPSASPRPKDAPRTMRDLRLARQAQAPGAPEAAREPAPRGPPPRARPRPGDPRPVRGDRRPRPPQGRAGAVPAVADEPPAPRVRRSSRSAGGYDDETLPGRVPGVAREVLARPAARRGRLARLRRADPLPAARLRRPRRLRRASAKRLDEIDKEQGTARQPPLLPRDPAVGVRRDRRPAGPGRARPRAPRRRLAADRHREAVRPRPRFGDPAQPRGRQGLPRVAGLPHRPLPRQGDRPEPARLPLRQRHLRADLEPPPHRPRPDHGRRVDRRREPRRVLRGDRRQPRLPPEPPAPADEPRRDGAAGDVRCRRAPRREGQGHPGDRRDDAGPDPGRRRPRPVRPGLGRRPSRSTAIARSPRSIRESETETFIAARLEVDDWRWSGVPFYLRTGKRLPKRATEIAIQFKEVPHRLFRDIAHGPRAEPAGDPDPAGRGDHAPLRRQGARASGSTSAR